MERGPLPETVRRHLHHLRHSVFTRDRGEQEEERRRGPGQLIVSSLPLQMCLYFNFYFYPFWWVCEIFMLHLKYVTLNTYQRIVLSALLTLMTIVEAIRIYLGYMGNLREKVPELAGFWLLTLLLQIPMTLFHTCSPRLVLLPLERGTSIVYLLFLVTEVLLAFTTLRHMVKQLELRFHLTHFDSLEHARRPWEHPDSERFPGDSVAGERFPGDSVAGERFFRGSIAGERFSQGSMAGERFPRDSVASERFSRGSIAGERFPGDSVAGERFSQGSVADERFPGGSTAGERFPGGSTAGERFSRGSTAGERFSRGSTAGERFPGARTDSEGPTDFGRMSLWTTAGHSGKETVSVLPPPGGRPLA